MTRGIFYKTNQQGNIVSLKSHSNWRATWDIIVPGKFTGGPFTDLFFYDAGAGEAKIFKTDGQGNVVPLKTTTGMRKTWDLIVPGRFRSGVAPGITELLFYDKSNGESKIMNVDSQGNLDEFKKHSWKDIWDIIVPGQFGGFVGGDDILFYDRETGTGKLFSSDGTGNFVPLHDNYIIEMRKTWDLIVNIEGVVPAGNDHLFFYDRSAGQGKFFTFLGRQLHQIMDTISGMRKTWDIIAPGYFGTSNNGIGLLFYDIQNGDAKVNWVTGGQGTFQNLYKFEELKTYSWPKLLHTVVSGKFTEGGADLLLYGDHNKAIYLDWGGYVDTEFQFSEFFDSPHTIMGWFMSQYPYAYPGPIFAENGSGVYMIGQGKYGDGNAYTDANENKIAGDPVLFMKIGNQKVIYIVPEFKINKWHHIAVIRKSNNKFRLFIDGKPQTPVSITGTGLTTPPTLVPISEIDASTISSKPIGKLRFGRRTSLQVTPATNFAAVNSYERGSYQAYGFLDDVAVFGKALTGPEIEDIFNKRRLSGSESGLVAFWPFDEPVTSNGPILKSWKPSRTPAIGSFPSTSLVPVRSVSSSRSSDNDSRHFESLFAINQKSLILPFPVGEIWKVNFGNNTFNSSHMNTTAFSYDLGQDKPTGKSVFCSHTGKAVYYVKNGHCSKNCLGVVDCNNECSEENQDKSRWRNFVKIRLREGEYTIYQHLGDGTLSQEITDKGTDDSAYIDDGFIISEQDAPLIKVGDLIGKIGGPACGPHLHIDAQNTWRKENNYQTTIPVAFVGYEESTDKINWRRVIRGQLKKGTWIRRI